ncbi:MAG TPA: hypothetical protein VF715_14000 [Thermoleophilaceae bacterium]
MKRTAPPGGAPPPSSATLPGGERIELVPLAEEITRRYLEEFPGDLERYGDVAREWGVHDNRYILAWTAGDLAGHPMLAGQVGWLASVLGARGFPLGQLARNLELAAEVLAERLPGERERIAELLGAAAVSVRASAQA